MWSKVKAKFSSAFDYLSIVFMLVCFIFSASSKNNDTKERSYWALLCDIRKAENNGETEMADFLRVDLRKRTKRILLYPVANFILFAMAMFLIALALHVIFVH